MWEVWGDGEVGRLGRWGDGEMGRWGDGEMGRFLLRVIIGSRIKKVNKIFSLFPIPDSRFPIPDSQFPIPDSLG
ncbi:hypothetical protein [Moorena producens]|uniref:hypothetical protein n=1 Tax=Moorena producens TaxID=1155739 RepID=UPI001314F7A7|nr:hypothetical protein [Moorena producens]